MPSRSKSTRRKQTKRSKLICHGTLTRTCVGDTLCDITFANGKPRLVNLVYRLATPNGAGDVAPFRRPEMVDIRRQINDTEYLGCRKCGNTYAITDSDLTALYLAESSLPEQPIAIAGKDIGVCLGTIVGVT